MKVSLTLNGSSFNFFKMYPVFQVTKVELIIVNAVIFNWERRMYYIAMKVAATIECNRLDVLMYHASGF